MEGARPCRQMACLPSKHWPTPEHRRDLNVGRGALYHRIKQRRTLQKRRIGGHSQGYQNRGCQGGAGPNTMVSQGKGAGGHHGLVREYACHCFGRVSLCQDYRRPLPCTERLLRSYAATPGEAPPRGAKSPC